MYINDQRPIANDQRPIGELIERFFERLAISEDHATTVWGQPAFGIPQTLVIDNGGAFSHASTFAGDEEAVGKDEMTTAPFRVVERSATLGIQGATMPGKKAQRHAESTRPRARRRLRKESFPVPYAYNSANNSANAEAVTGGVIACGDQDVDGPV